MCWNRQMGGAGLIWSQSAGQRRLPNSIARIPTFEAEPTIWIPWISIASWTAPTWCWFTNGMSTHWWKRLAGDGRGVVAFACCFMTLITVR
jgi:hypothetical protein